MLFCPKIIKHPDFSSSYASALAFYHAFHVVKNHLFYWFAGIFAARVNPRGPLPLKGVTLQIFLGSIINNQLGILFYDFLIDSGHHTLEFKYFGIYLYYCLISWLISVEIVAMFSCLLIVLKLLKMARSVRALLDTVMQALPEVGNLGLLFFLLFYIFAALGVELFGKVGKHQLLYLILCNIFVGEVFLSSMLMYLTALAKTSSINWVAESSLLFYNFMYILFAVII